MFKVKEIIKTIFEIFALCIILILSVMFTWASINNISINEMIKDFMDKAEFEFEQNDTYYYAVKSDKVVDDTITFKGEYQSPVLGARGDIFVMPQSRMDYVPLFAEFTSYLFGGHAGVIVDGESIVEALGGSVSEDSVYDNYNDLFIEERTVVGLRVKATKEERKKAASTALSLVGKQYNYWFILNTKDSYYCTDLCARVYSGEFDSNYNLDQTSFHTTVQDLMLSNDTEISFVKYKSNGKTYIYYLKSNII